MMKIYAGIGSRKTPKKILEQMRNISSFLAKEGYTLRSGGADGADSAFEDGCDLVLGEKKYTFLGTVLTGMLLLAITFQRLLLKWLPKYILHGIV